MITFPPPETKKRTDLFSDSLDAYIEAADIAADKKGPLLRAAIGKTGRLSDKPMSRKRSRNKIQRWAGEAELETEIGCHTFRATGIMDYLWNGGRLKVAQKMAGHSNPKTTGLYDRRGDDVSLDEVERIGDIAFAIPPKGKKS